MRRARVRAIAALGATLLVAGCAGGGGTASPDAATPTGATPGTAAATTGGASCALVNDGTAATAVAASGFAFSPAAVSVAVGGTVTWSNGDSVGHTVTMNDGSCDSGVFGGGRSVTLRFTTVGTYGYACSIHPSMTGAVEVTG